MAVKINLMILTTAWELRIIQFKRIPAQENPRKYPV